MSNINLHTAEKSQSATRQETEIDRELSLLSAALSTLSIQLGDVLESLDAAGVLVPPLPEPELLRSAEMVTSSPMGNRILGIRSDICSLTDHIRRISARMAI